MREKKTEVYARDLVRKLRENGDIIDFVDSCMQTASWLGRFSGRNRFMFHDAIRSELKLDGFEREDKKRKIRRLACLP